MANGQTRIETMYAYVVLDPTDNTEGVEHVVFATETDLIG